MIFPVRPRLELRRNVPYVEVFEFLTSMDTPRSFVGCTGVLEVRDYGKEAGDALIRLESVSLPVPGVRCTSTSVEIRFAQADIDGLPGGPADGDEPNTPSTFVFDLMLTPPGGNAAIWMEGPVHVYPGVTRDD